MEFQIGKKFFHLIVNPVTVPDIAIFQFVSLLDVIVSEYGEGYRLESKEEASEESKWRETRVRRKIAEILCSEYEPLNI